MTEEEAQNFIDYYDSTAEAGSGAWKRGNSIITDWRKLLLTWKNTAASKRKTNGDPNDPYDHEEDSQGQPVRRLKGSNGLWEDDPSRPRVSVV